MTPIRLLISGVVLYIAGCTTKGNPQPRVERPALPVLQVREKDTTLARTYVASINARQHVELRAKATGFLERIYADEGKFVTAGQPLFKLNDTELRVQLAEQQAALARAQAEVKTKIVEQDRVRTLVNKKILTASELDLANVAVDAARARVDEESAKLRKAQIAVGYTLVRAPFDGVIGRILHKTGSLVDDGTLLTTVSDVQAMHVYFNVSEQEYLDFIRAGKKTGQEALLLLADESAYPEKGRIETIDGEFDRATGSIAFRALFPNPQRVLKHGSSGKIVLNAAVPKALIIPQKSIFEVQDKNYVFLVKSDNTVTMQNIVPGARFDEFVLVKSGLKPGERIVYEGVQNLREGAVIEPRTVSADSLLATR